MGDMKLPLMAIVLSGTLCAGVNEWTNVGPQGGSIQNLVVDPQNPAIVYASTGVGVFKSKDAGASWSNAGLSGFGLNRLSVEHNNVAGRTIN